MLQKRANDGSLERFARPDENPSNLIQLFIVTEKDKGYMMVDDSKHDRIYRFFYDAASKIVYRCRSEPQVLERKHRGKLTGWQVYLETDVTRADNWLESPNRWHFPIMEPRQQEFDYPRYTREQAIDCFMQRHSPKRWNTVEIDAQIYKEIETEYKARALNNKPASNNLLQG